MPSERDWAKLNGYNDIRFIVPIRSWYPTICSQEYHGHVGHVEEAKKNIDRAILNIFGQIAEHDLDYIVVNYEAFVLHPYHEAAVLLGRLGLDFPDKQTSVSDENLKWFPKFLQRNVSVDEIDLSIESTDWARVLPLSRIISNSMAKVAADLNFKIIDTMILAQVVYGYIVASAMDMVEPGEESFIAELNIRSVNELLTKIKDGIDEIPTGTTKEGSGKSAVGDKNSNGAC